MKGGFTVTRPWTFHRVRAELPRRPESYLRFRLSAKIRGLESPAVLLDRWVEVVDLCADLEELMTRENVESITAEWSA